jgi:hypothetical protein
LPLKLDFIEDIKNKQWYHAILFKIKAILNKINVLRKRLLNKTLFKQLNLAF